MLRPAGSSVANYTTSPTAFGNWFRGLILEAGELLTPESWNDVALWKERVMHDATVRL